MNLYLVFFVILFQVVFAINRSREMEGYSYGYLSDCPTTNRTPIITKRSLKSLSLVFQAEGHFLLAKRKAYNYYQMEKLVKDPQMDFKRMTIIYVGGFLDSPSFFFSGEILHEYRKLGYNVLSLDVNKFTTIEYPVAALFMRTVGKHGAEMLVKLMDLGLDPGTVELIGLSLGAQTAGFIAKNFQQMSGRNISRITALDPAGPCFRNLDKKDRLYRSDADWVEVISTNIEGFGMAAPVGHVNFYVNGGEYQPGAMLWMYCDIICSHVRSVAVWVSAINNPKSFKAIQCDSVQDARLRNCYDRVPRVVNVLGFEVDRSKQGIFYLATTNTPPFYLGDAGLKKENEFYSSYMKKIMDSQSMTI